MADKQTQRAGDNSQQVQVAGNAIIVQGVTEERAREIARAAAQSVLDEYTEEASGTAFRRSEAFTDRLVMRLSESEQLAVFKDPAFQVLLRKAEFGAASTERVNDYDLLASLLDDRAKRNERPVWAAIDRAVEVVNLVDDEALTALTVATAVLFTPVSGFVPQGLDALDNLYKELLLHPLPPGDAWLDHLDTLDMVRLSPGGISQLKKLDQVYADSMNGYMSMGVDEARDAELQTTAAELGINIQSISHELKPGYRRLPFVNERTARVEIMRIEDEKIREQVLGLVFDEYGVGTKDPTLHGRLVEEIDKRASLSKVRAWWDNIPLVFSLTGVGRVLAKANLAHCDHAGHLALSEE